MIDLIQHHFGELSPSRKCLDHGFVRLVDTMPRLIEESGIVAGDDGSGRPIIDRTKSIITADHAITQAARVSYGAGTKSVSEDRGLIRYLMRHQHTTPFEMVEFKFHCAMPLFVARQWIRHRTANVNEMSGRYSVIPDKFYIPSPAEVRQQSNRNKQVSEGSLNNQSHAEEFVKELNEMCDGSYEMYEKALEKGVGREQARMILPVNIYTEWYWKCDAHNLLHFLKLRCDAHAQYEIRVYGEAMLELVQPIIPWTIEAWNDFNPYRGAVTFSRLEMEKLKNLLNYDEVRGALDRDGKIIEWQDQLVLGSGNKREDAEWSEKLKKLGVLP